MLFYLAIFFIIFLLTLVEEYSPVQKRHYYSIMMLIILTFIAGFRIIGGYDIYNYQAIYERTPLLGDFIKNFTILAEYYQLPYGNGYLFYISFIKTFLGLSFYGYLLLQSIIFYALLYKGLRKYTNHWGIFMLLFLYKLFFYETFVSMRQPLTIVMFYMIMHFIQEKKALKYYLILTFLILPFHDGAIILFFVYLISFFKISKKRIIILNCIFIPTLIFSLLGIDPLGNFSFGLNNLLDKSLLSKIDVYANTDNSFSSWLRTTEYLLIMVLLITNYDKIEKSHKYAPLIIKLFLILLPMMTLFKDIIFFRRETSYFVPSYAFILGYICNIYINRKFFIITVFAILCLYGFLRFAYSWPPGALLPYKSWLNIPNASLFRN